MNYSKNIIVEKHHLDELNHVNNIQYLNWVQDISKEHWNVIANTKELKQIIWVVYKHEITYLDEAKLNDNLTIDTRIQPLSGFKSDRIVEFYKKEKCIAKCITTWISIDPLTKKPKRVVVG